MYVFNCVDKVWTFFACFKKEKLQQFKRFGWIDVNQCYMFSQCPQDQLAVIVMLWCGAKDTVGFGSATGSVQGTVLDSMGCRVLCRAQG